MALVVDNPATGETACTVELTPAEAVDDLVARAHGAATEIAALSVSERVTLCERFCTEIERASETIARDLTRQMGKPIAQARAEVATMLARARYMMSIAEDALVPAVPLERDGFELVVEKVPLGVVLDIAAWNYPLLIPVNVVVPAVLAGNAVVLKHSSRTPLCAGHFADAFRAAGAPAGAVVALIGDHATTERVIAHPGVGYVSFTGSVEGGRQVSRAARGRFIDVGLELGGNDPAYVRADADIAWTAEQIADGAFYNTGQSCCAVERVYVDRRVHDRFVSELVTAAGRRVAGDPQQDATTLGPMAQASGLETVRRQVDAAASTGATIACGGRATTVAGRGRYFEATVLTGVSDEMEVMREETFGPVAPVLAVDGDEDALARMNRSRYGLTASIWTRDLASARKIASGIEAGTVFLNRCDYLDPALPWSGWKDSGVGLSLSRAGFDRLVHTRARHFRLDT